jgi:hypothetical protein
MQNFKFPFAPKVKMYIKKFDDWMSNGLFWWSNEFMNDELIVEPNWVVKYKFSIEILGLKIESKMMRLFKFFGELNVILKFRIWWI